VKLIAGDRTVREGSMEVAEGEEDFWTFIDIGFLHGQRVIIEVDMLANGSRVLERFQVSDEIKGTWPVYGEPGRPAFHFTPRRGWINDPNGLVYYGGEYHLFFQHNPYGWNWAAMHWGHAVSRDLIHWQEVEEALFPDELGTMCSGTAVVDHGNTSGLGEEGRDPLVVFYTAMKVDEAFVQGMAYSLDGKTFKKYPGNPVVSQIRWSNRDPKVFWHAASSRWVMALYVPGEPDPHSGDDTDRPFFRYEIHFLSSDNLRTWSKAGVFPGGFGNDFCGIDRFLYECPDMYLLPVDNEPTLKRWVLTAANGGYTLGEFDGKMFFANPDVHFPGRSEVFSAGQVFNNEPSGRWIQLGFLRAPTPGMPFNQCLSVPLELSLRSARGGVRLCASPVEELKALRSETITFSAGPLAPGANPLETVFSEAFDLELEISPRDARWLAINLNGISLVYDVACAELVCRSTRLALHADSNGRVSLRLLVDRSTVEVFGESGLVYYPIATPLSQSRRKISLSAIGGEAEIHHLSFHKMTSIWKPS
jgi:sucrose-6-phosphate hydrolase SacC (GH32 family)